jgi:hypothetical protein
VHTAVSSIPYLYLDFTYSSTSLKQNLKIVGLVDELMQCRSDDGRQGVLCCSLLRGLRGNPSSLSLQATGTGRQAASLFFPSTSSIFHPTHNSSNSSNSSDPGVSIDRNRHNYSPRRENRECMNDCSLIIIRAIASRARGGREWSCFSSERE